MNAVFAVKYGLIQPVHFVQPEMVLGENIFSTTANNSEIQTMTRGPSEILLFVNGPKPNMLKEWCFL